MLINFKFKNCRSFYDEANLSMEATKDSEYQEINTFKVRKGLINKNDELIKSAVIFGGNASGKSNVIKALDYMRTVVAYSAAQIFPYKTNEPFAFLDTADKEDSLYEVEFIQNNIYYDYGFVINEGLIMKEWLHRRDGRLTKVFVRTKTDLDISGLNKQSTKFINIAPNVLFLSVGNNFQLGINQYLIDAMTWFRNLLLVFDDRNENVFDIYNLENGKYKKQALEILKLADIGITDIEVKKDKLVDMNDPDFMQKLQMKPLPVKRQIMKEAAYLFQIDLKTNFNIYDGNNNVSGVKEVLLLENNGFNSEGTEKLLSYLGYILAALDLGKVIFIDEIDSKLHFLVADYLISLFNSIDNNPKNAQLICTAHNVMLMDERLRRDQIYFTCKNKQGMCCLMSLSDFKNVRKSDLYSKKYLAGFYADLPDMVRR